MRGWGTTMRIIEMLVCLLVLLAAAPEAQARRKPAKDKPAKERLVAGQLIVKYYSDGPVAVTECVHCLLKHKKRFQPATSDASDSLDQLNATYQVRSARPLFRTEADEAKIAGSKTAAALKQYHRTRAEALKTQFPHRAKRAPKDAIAPDLSHVYVLELSPSIPVATAADAFAQDPHVVYAQPNYVVEVQALPNDTYVDPDQNGTWSKGAWNQPYEDLWGMKQIEADAAWSRPPAEQGGDCAPNPGVQPCVVAVLDTGVDSTHPDLAANMWTNAQGKHGYDFIANDTDPQDSHGHGTHIAGIIGAVANNGSGPSGVAGVAPAVKLMAVKILNDTGQGSDTTIADGILYAVANGADVINGSWACHPPGCPVRPALDDQVEYARSQGVVVVLAAGNDADEVAYYAPQNQPGAIVVAASDRTDHRAVFSNYGVSLDIAAPGVDILSTRIPGASPPFCPSTTVGGNYCRAYGTSMAAPHVAGAAALLLAKHVNDPVPFTTEHVRQALRVSATPLHVAATNRAIQAGLVSNPSPLAALETPLIFVTGATCTGTTCKMYEKPDLTFAPLTFTVTAMDLDGNLSYLWSYLLVGGSPYSLGRSLTISRLDASTIRGTFTWSQTGDGLPISFTNLSRCNTTYGTSFSAGNGRGQRHDVVITVEFVRCGSDNPLCPTPVNHAPMAKARYSGQVFAMTPPTVGPNKIIGLNSSGSCDPDGDVIYYKWNFTGSYPPNPNPTSLPPSPTNYLEVTAPSVTQETDMGFFSLTVSGAGGDPPMTVTLPTLRVKPGCWIATAAFGSPQAPELEILRAYRDTVLSRSPLGRTLLDFYYRHSPPLARFIAQKPWLRALVRQALAPLIRLAKQQVERR